MGCEEQIQIVLGLIDDSLKALRQRDFTRLKSSLYALWQEIIFLQQTIYRMNKKEITNINNNYYQKDIAPLDKETVNRDPEYFTFFLTKFRRC